MGYLANQNNEIIVDAILTKYGREKLASGQQLGILKFALSDDEVDYTLYNANHPMGSDFFDLAIRSLPILEPVPNSTRQFRYFLYSTTSTVSYVYTLSATSVPSIFTSGITQVGSSYTFGASLTPIPTNLSQVWYSVKFPKANASYIKLEGIVDQSIGVPQDLAQLIQTYGGTVSEFQDSVIAYGHSFKITVLSLPPKRTIFSVVIDANNVAASSLNITITLDKYAGSIIGDPNTER
jgi:hypothetical protein